MSKTILTIEDDNFLRELIVLKLKKENYNVLEAIDGEEGIKKIKKQRPDLVLLDLVMPGINGFEVLSQIKADSILSSIPVIVFSNLGQKVEIERALELGASDFLIKAHLTLEEVVEKIKLIFK